MEKLQRLREKFRKAGWVDESVFTQLDNWEKSYKTSTMFLKLQDNDAFKKLLDLFQEAIDNIDIKLMTVRDISEDERKRLFDKKECLELIADTLSQHKTNVEQIESDLDSELSS